MITGSYRRVERVAIVVGLFELAFFFVAWVAHPGRRRAARGQLRYPVRQQGLPVSVAANIGAVVMPWMIFYQQSAIADKRLRLEHYSAARWDTAVGAVVTQLIMAAVLMACAATIGRCHPDASLATVGEMAQALTPFLGTAVGNLVFGLGVLGAGMVAAIVVSLAFAWGLGEVAGYRRSLELHPLKPVGSTQSTRPAWSSGLLSSGVAGSGVTECGCAGDERLLLPLVLGFLIGLAVKTLPPAHRLRGLYLWLVVIVSVVTCALGVFGGFSGAGLLRRVG